MVSCVSRGHLKVPGKLTRDTSVDIVKAAHRIDDIVKLLTLSLGSAAMNGARTVDKPTTVQQGGVGLGYVRLTQAKGKQDRRRVTVTGKTDT